MAEAKLLRARGAARTWPRSARRGSTSTATGRPREDQRRVSRPDRDRPPGRQAAGDPHALGRRSRRTMRCPRRCRSWRTEAEGVDGDPALLLCAARAGGGGGGERLVLLVRRPSHLPEGGGAPRGGEARPGRADPGRDRLAVPGAAVAAGEAERAGAGCRDGARGSCGAWDGIRRVRRLVEANAAGVPVVASWCAARPELPRRHEPAGRDRPRGRALAGRRRPRGRRRAGRADRAARRARPRPCT